MRQAPLPRLRSPVPPGLRVLPCGPLPRSAVAWCTAAAVPWRCSLKCESHRQALREGAQAARPATRPQHWPRTRIPACRGPAAAAAAAARPVRPAVRARPSVQPAHCLTGWHSQCARALHRPPATGRACLPLAVQGSVCAVRRRRGRPRPDRCQGRLRPDRCQGRRWPGRCQGRRWPGRAHWPGRFRPGWSRRPAWTRGPNRRQGRDRRDRLWRERCALLRAMAGPNRPALCRTPCAACMASAAACAARWHLKPSC